MYSSGDFTVQSSKKRKRRDGQVDRQVFTAFEARTTRLDGHVAAVRHERRPKIKQVSTKKM